MKIALIIHELLVEGGGERQCLSLARALVLQGHDITLYTSAYEPANCFPQICKDLTVKQVGRGCFPRLRRPRFIRGYFDMIKLASAVKENHEVWNPHHWPAQWGAVWLKQRLGGAVLWMCNDVPTFYAKAHNRQSIGDRLQSPVHWLYYFYDRAVNRGIDLTLFLSNWAESEFRAIYSAKSRVVRSGADVSRFRPGGERVKIRHRFGFKPEDFVLLWLGIFMPHRRLEDAIEAVSILRTRGVRVRLLLAGSDRSFPEYFNSLKALANNLGSQQTVTFTGKVEESEIRDFYCACDAFLFPNENQTWGLTVLEAMACGCPVLVSRGAAVHEVLTDNINAVLFSPRDPEALADRIETLLGQPHLRRQIAESGMQLARTVYNWEQFAMQVFHICEELSGHGETETLVPGGKHQMKKR